MFESHIAAIRLVLDEMHTRLQDLHVVHQNRQINTTSKLLVGKYGLIVGIDQTDVDQRRRGEAVDQNEAGIEEFPARKPCSFAHNGRNGIGWTHTADLLGERADLQSIHHRCNHISTLDSMPKSHDPEGSIRRHA